MVGVRADSAIAGDTQTVEDLLEEVVGNLGDVTDDSEAADALSEELTAALVTDKGWTVERELWSEVVYEVK